MSYPELGKLMRTYQFEDIEHLYSPNVLEYDSCFVTKFNQAASRRTAYLTRTEIKLAKQFVEDFFLVYDFLLGELVHSNQIYDFAFTRLSVAHEKLGFDSFDILVRCLCLGGRVQEEEKCRRWPARSGKIIIKIALRRLAEIDYLRCMRRPQSNGIGSICDYSNKMRKVS